MAAAFNPLYDPERQAARPAVWPRHADVALVTGPVTRNMTEPLRRTVAVHLGHGPRRGRASGALTTTRRAGVRADRSQQPYAAHDFAHPASRSTQREPEPDEADGSGAGTVLPTYAQG